ncbi:MAG TPA: zf-HC2 domain-containing protein [Candidatus Binataceae bacterium]|nr:zf-HC2 domain-containing protein [Candidatus Binataceae bacterium]
MWSAHHPETALLPYLNGELSVEESARLRAHLKDCARCQEELAAAETVIQQVARRVEQIPEPDWTAYNYQLRRKLNARRSEPVRRWRPGLVWASAAATAAVAASAIVLALTLAPRPRPAMVAVDQLEVEGELADANIGLLRAYPVVENMDLLENYDVIKNLDQLAPPSRPHVVSRS